jgi:hypothetical protein
MWQQICETCSAIVQCPVCINAHRCIFRYCWNIQPILVSYVILQLTEIIREYYFITRIFSRCRLLKSLRKKNFVKTGLISWNLGWENGEIHRTLTVIGWSFTFGGFGLITATVGFVVYRVAVGQVFTQTLSCSLLVLFHQCSILIFHSPTTDNT